jgi:hypothetical protein
MNYISPFAPGSTAGTSLLAVTTTSARVAAKTSATYVKRIRIYNAGSVDAFVEFGDATVTATVPVGGTPGSMPVPAGAVEVLTCAQSDVAAICASGTTTLYITPGEGI